LFFDWRYLPDGKDDPKFELNQPAVAGASVLLARRNFGNGSSREHAVWALENYGFRTVIAPSFADIFYNNCFKNGVLPVKLAEEQVEELFQRWAANPGYQLTVDLQQQLVSDDLGLSLPFITDEFRRHCMLNGLDDIALTLQSADRIAAYEQARGMPAVA
jgi:3-isopropylmalate/(R)-2-methylmalate dehydratase small subunit